MSGLVSSATLEQIRAANDIVELISSYLPLKKAGGAFVALCPFHREKSPSFHVNPQRQIFHCFGCNKGGDVFTFLREYESLTFMEAVRRLAERGRIPLTLENNPQQAAQRGLKEQLYQVHEQIAARWQQALQSDPRGEIARTYLEKRGIRAEMVSLFRLGYAPDAWDDTVNWGVSKSHPSSLLEQAGLVVRKEGTDRTYDRFRGRLMFPICDEQGRVIAFSGRILEGDEKTAKYVNSPETLIFTKGRVFYGLDKSKRAILDQQRAIICEGQIDLIAMYQAGIHNVVAPQGTAFTADHARLLKRYADETVLCFDADTAGQNAILRALDSLLPPGFSIRVVNIPPPEDPDSFIKKYGGEAFAKLVEQAPGFFDFQLEILCQRNDTQSDRGKSVVVKAMAAQLAKTKNQVLIEEYERKTAVQLGVSPLSVHQEFKRLLKLDVRSPFQKDSLAERTPPRSSGPPSGTENAEGSGSSDEPPLEALEGQGEPAAPYELPVLNPREKALIEILLQSDDHVEWFLHHLDPAWVENPLLRELVELRYELYGSEDWTGLAAWIDSLRHRPDLQQLATSSIALTRVIPHPERQRQEIALRIRNHFYDRCLLSCTSRMGNSSLNDADRVALLQQQGDWRKRKTLPLTPRLGFSL